MVRGNDGGSASFTLTLGPPLNLPLGGGGDGSRERGFRGGNGGLGAVREPPLRVFLWIPAYAGKTGGCLNRRLRGFSQMGYDAPLPFVPGFWVPAYAGMTVYLRLSPSPWDPLLISPWEGEGDGSRERGLIDVGAVARPNRPLLRPGTPCVLASRRGGKITYPE